MNDHARQRSARVPASAASRVEPLFPHARLLKAEGLKAEQLVAEAAKSLEQAREQARQILDQAHAEADVAKRSAREEGRSEGRRELNDLLKSATTELESLRRSMESQVRTVAVALAGKLLEKELQQRPEAIESLLRIAMAQAKWAKSVTILANDRDLPLIQAAMEGLRDLVPGATTFSVKVDAAVAPSCFRIKTELGMYAGGLEAVKAALDRRGEGGQ